MVPILALGTLVYPLLMIRNAFAATGDTHMFAAVSIVQAASLIFCVTTGFFAFGLVGAVAGVALHRIIPAVATIILARQRNWIAIRRELWIIPAFILGVLVAKSAVSVAMAFGLTNIHQVFHRP